MAIDKPTKLEILRKAEEQRAVEESHVWLPEFDEENLKQEGGGERAVERAVEELMTAARNDESVHISSLIAEVPEFYQWDIMKKILNLDERIISMVVADHLSEWRYLPLGKVVDKLCELGLADKIVDRLDDILENVRIHSDGKNDSGKLSALFARELHRMNAAEAIKKIIVKQKGELDVVYLEYYWEYEATHEILRTLFDGGCIEFIWEHIKTMIRCFEPQDGDIVDKLIETVDIEDVFDFAEEHFSWDRYDVKDYPVGYLFFQKLEPFASKSKKIKKFLNSHYYLQGDKK